MINKNNPEHTEGSISQNEHGHYFLGVQLSQGQGLGRTRGPHPQPRFNGYSKAAEHLRVCATCCHVKAGLRNSRAWRLSVLGIYTAIFIKLVCKYD